MKPAPLRVAPIHARLDGEHRLARRRDAPDNVEVFFAGRPLPTPVI